MSDVLYACPECGNVECATDWFDHSTEPCPACGWEPDESKFTWHTIYAGQLEADSNE